MTGLQKIQLLNEEEIARAQDEHGEENFTVGIGAEAVLEMLKKHCKNLNRNLQTDPTNRGTKSERT